MKRLLILLMKNFLHKINWRITAYSSLLLIFCLALVYLFASKNYPNFFIGKNASRDTVATLATAKINSQIKILFVGDMMFDRNIRLAAQKDEDIVFAKMQNFLQSYDLVVGNLEGPITDNHSVSTNTRVGSAGNMVFTFDPKIAHILNQENIKLVNIGNNHITNFGNKGLESTRNYLSQANVNFFGDPENNQNRFFIENIKGRKIAFVNYNQFVANAESKALEDIAAVKNLNADFIILYTHWGDEYVYDPSQQIKNLAHEFVDAGADLIIGTHPHVIETKEEYKGKQIYYSLGNFVFDQYFDARTQEGMAVEVDIDSNKQFDFQDYKIKMQKNGQTMVLDK